MAFIDGTDLQARLKSEPLPVREACSICSDVAAALQFAHENGIIHCDLKPANVLVGTDQRVTVTDFGFACILSEASPPRRRSAGGTAGYMPPEIVESRCPPARSTDIYALGAMLWTLVTGRVPVDHGAVRAPRPELESIAETCRRCLAFEPEERFETMSDVIVAMTNSRAQRP